MKKRWGWIAVAALVIIGVGFAWFWSLAAVAPEQVSEVTLRVERAPVQVRASGETAFREALNGITLTPGTVVKTGEGGRATIVFFGKAESRLDANSEVTIVDAAETGESATVQLDLGVGRMWSRVLRLLDLDSSFSVKTSSVVATVRGTAFDVRANADGSAEVWVSESVVRLATVAQQSAPVPAMLLNSEFRITTSTPMLTAGESMQFDARGNIKQRRRLQAEDQVSAWVMENRAADTVFLREAAERARKTLDGKNSAASEAADGLTRWSERLHVALAKGEVKNRKLETYIARRIASAVSIAEAGKTGLAAQMFSRFENDVKHQLSGAESERSPVLLRAALTRVAPLLQDALPGSAAYPFKQKVEDLVVMVSEPSEALTVYARLRAAEARLDEAHRLIDAGSLEDARTVLSAVRGGLDNAHRESIAVRSKMSDEHCRVIDEKMLALFALDASERARLEIAQHAVDAQTSTEDSVSVSSTVPVAPLPPTVTTPVVPGIPQYVSIQLFAQPNPLTVSQGATLAVDGVRKDGSRVQITSASTFRVVQGAGLIEGRQIIATVPGTVVIEASYKDNGTMHTARASLNVAEAVILQSLETSALPMQIRAGASATLSATARYSNGYSQDVSGRIKWSNLSPTLGTIAGNTFTAVSANGPVTIPRTGITAQFEATYTEGGMTKTSTVTVLVLP